MEAKVTAALEALKGKKFTAEQLSDALASQGMSYIHRGLAMNHLWTSGRIVWSGRGNNCIGRVA